MGPSLIGVGAQAADFYLSTGRMPLNNPRDPPVRNPPIFSRGQINDLEARLAARMPRKGDYTVTDTPHRAICDGCPAEGGLCSWPLAMTRRAAPDQLF